MKLLAKYENDNKIISLVEFGVDVYEERIKRFYAFLGKPQNVNVIEFEPSDFLLTYKQAMKRFSKLIKTKTNIEYGNIKS